jgi:hypothetical protein
MKPRTLSAEILPSAICALALLVFAVPSAFGQTNSNWLGGSGNWVSTPCANWSTCPQTPDGNFNVFITTSNSTINLSGTVGVVNTTIGSSDTLAISGSGFTSNINNSGDITLAKSSDSIASDGGSIINSGTMQGQGAIFGGGPMTNSGLINANVSGGTLTIQPSNAGGMTNTGTMQASNGGTLFLESSFQTNYNNTGGTIQALNGSTVGLFAVTITGGVLTTSGTGVIETFGGGANPILNNLTNAGTFKILGSGGAALEGTVNNTGTIQLLSTGGATDLFVTGTATLKGSGTVTMSDSPSNLIVSLNGGSNQLINQSTIQGAGSIGDVNLTLTNQGTIDANATTNRLVLTGAAASNTGTLEASNGGTLEVHNVLNNTGGTIQALNGSTVLISGTVAGGTLTTSGSGTFQAASGTLDGSVNTVTNAGNFVVANGFDLTLLGTINNTGTLSVADNSSGIIIGSATATLQGTGTLTLSNNGGITGIPNSILVNKSTIDGAGVIGVNGVLSLTNQGTINANSASNTLILQSGTVLNTSTLEATSGGTLVIRGSKVTNTGGTIEAQTGSSVLLAGPTITGGTLTTTGTGVVGTNNLNTGVVLNGVTNAGNYVVADSSSTTLQGKITNNGTISLNSLGGGAFLNISGNVTLKGKGDVILSNSSTNIIEGASTGKEILTNASTIEGAGNIGNDFMGLVNTGTILANNGTLTIFPDSKNFKNSGKLIVDSGSAMNITGPAATSFTTSGTVTINSGGSLTVNGNATYKQTGTKSTTVDGTLTASNGINIAGGTVFGNMGKLVGNFNLSGTAAISPGDGIKKVGELIVNGSYTQGATASALIDLGGLNSGMFDVVNITNSATLNGKLVVDLVNGFNPVAGDNFDVMNYASETGVFSSETLPVITGDHWLVTIGATDVLLQLLAGPGATRERGGSFDAHGGGGLAGYVPPTALPPTFDDSGFSNSDAQQSQTPEPSGLLLLGSALLALGAFALRHVRKRFPYNILYNYFTI